MGNLTESGGSELQAVTAVLNRLRGRFPNAAPDRIEREVMEVYHQFDGRPIRDFIPILVERAVIDRLSARRQELTPG